MLEFAADRHTSTACALSSSSSTTSSASSCVAANTTGGATPAKNASSQRETHRHQRSPAFNPGKLNSGRGVIKSLPSERLNIRNAVVTCAQTVCDARSAGPLLHEPSRRYPVGGVMRQLCSGPPKTFLAADCCVIGLLASQPAIVKLPFHRYRASPPSVHLAASVLFSRMVPRSSSNP